MISVQEALALISEYGVPRAAQTITLNDALSCVLAEDVKAKVSRPPISVSAMDGYAVRLSDVGVPGVSLGLIGEAPAGTPFRGRVGAGEAVRIFTGGAVPDGADHIVIQEDVERRGDQVICALSYDAPAYLRAKGLDFDAGKTLLTAGTRIGPAALAIAAAGNHAEVPVWKRPVVAVLANGDELVPPGTPMNEGQIVNSNPAALAALVDDWGGRSLDLGIAADSVDAIVERIAGASADIDIFVPVGGASVGDHDHMREAFRAAGFETIFEKVAVRPGKPTWLAKRGEQIVLGLPGNPASALVCAHLFLKPLVTRQAEHDIYAAQLEAPLGANGPREAYLRGVASLSGAARLTVRAAGNQDSSLLTPFSKANCLIRRLPNAAPVEAGEIADVLLIKSL